jgi:predicted phage gp36 major capsid-like protein
MEQASTTEDADWVTDVTSVAAVRRLAALDDEDAGLIDQIKRLGDRRADIAREQDAINQALTPQERAVAGPNITQLNREHREARQQYRAIGEAQRQVLVPDPH